MEKVLTANMASGMLPSVEGSRKAVASVPLQGQTLCNSIQMDQELGNIWAGIRPREMNCFRLPVYETFPGRPYHLDAMEGRWDRGRLWSELGESVIRSDVYVSSTGRSGTSEEFGYRLLARISKRRSGTRAIDIESLRATRNPWLESCL